MLATHRDEEKRYGKVRQDVISQLNKGYTDSGENAFCAKLFDNDSLNKMLEWSYSLKRRAEWDWVKLYASFQARNPKRFEMALWYKGDLISASLGKPSYNGSRMCLEYIEASPDKPKDISVTGKNLAAFALYADVLGASELRIMNPVNQEVRDYYSRFGLSYNAKGGYMATKL